MAAVYSLGYTLLPGIPGTGINGLVHSIIIQLLIKLVEMGILDLNLINNREATPGQPLRHSLPARVPVFAQHGSVLNHRLHVVL